MTLPSVGIHRSIAARLAPVGAAFVLVGCATLGGPAPLDPPPVLIEFQLLATGETSSLDAHDFEGGVVYLEPDVLASDLDLARPRLTQVDAGWQLDVRFTAEAGVRLDQALLDAAGRKLAMVVDSRIGRVLDVRPQLGASVLRATLDYSEREAARLREIVDVRWP